MKNKNKLTIRLTKNYFYTITLVTVILVGIPLIIGMLASLRIWSGDEFIYPMMHFLNKTLIFWIIGVPLVIWLIVTYVYFRKIMGYLEDMLDGTKKIIEEPENVVMLRPDLSEFEHEINQIREESLENKRTSEELEKKKKDLLLYLAHDLRTPLTSIVGYVALLQNLNFVSSDSKEGKKYVRIISEKAYRLENLINDFFEIAKISVGKIKLERQKINLSLMLEQVSSEFLPFLDEKQLIWNLKIEKDVYVSVDVNKFERVLDNIIRNSIAYAQLNSEISLSLRQADSAILLSLSNKSKELSNKAMNHVFDPFFRGDHSRNTQTGNAGLGLAIAKQIIEEHGGKIEANSVNDTFEINVYIPKISS